MNMLMLWLLACGDKESSTDTGTETDTGVETETDTGTEEETDTSSETEEETDTGTEEEEEEIVGTPVTFDLSDAEGMKIGLLRVQFTDDGIEFDDNKVVTSELGDVTSHTIGVEDPSTEELSALIPENETLIGMWAPYLFQDSNGDNTFNEGEIIGGIGRTWLVYSTGDIAEFNVDLTVPTLVRHGDQYTTLFFISLLYFYVILFIFLSKYHLIVLFKALSKFLNLNFLNNLRTFTLSPCVFVTSILLKILEFLTLNLIRSFTSMENFSV